MGYRTDFIGHILVDPPLNEAEYVYLTAFAESRRFRRPGGPYVVPDNPMAEISADVTGSGVDDYNTPPSGQPGLWCPWEPSCQGACLAVRNWGDGKHYAPTAWLQYLVDHFLRQGAAASHDTSGEFSDFTFDHALAGAVAAHRSDTGRLWLIRPDASRITEETVWPGDGWV
jgi:hypothetical protein